MTHKKKVSFLLACAGLFCFVFISPVYSNDFGEGFHTAKIKNISDRKYEPAVIELLNGAEESIVISMYIFKPSGKGPVRLLAKNLEEALERGIRVEMYLNTRFKVNYASDINTGKPFELLQEKGAKIYLVSSSVLLHDKLLIVDKRYVVIGSTNWSVSAFKNNLEASSLIDSEIFAKEMLVRLRRFPLKGQKSRKSKRPDRPKIERTLSKESVITLSKALLKDKSLFPRMVSRLDNRAMNTYLLLLSYAEVWKEKEFFVSLEDLTLDLRMPSGWSDTALRRQVIKTLKKLQNRYKLIDVNFRHGKDAWITIREVESEALADSGPNTFKLGSYFFNPDFLSSKSSRVKFVLLIKTLLQEEGTPIDSFTRKEIAKRFYIDRGTLRKALKEISEK